MRKLSIFMLAILGSIFMVGCDGTSEKSSGNEKGNNITDAHIRILESEESYEKMDVAERITAIEIAENYWDELNDEQKKKFAERKEDILKAQEIVAEKRKKEMDEQWKKDRENESELDERESFKDKNKDDGPATETNALHTITNVKHGELLSVTVNGKTIVVKTKISPSYNNKATINQNGFNVENIVLNQGSDKFDEIQYWAVSDMTGGGESKVISFTVNKENITAIKNKQLVGNLIVENSSDLWILPSLLE